MRIAVIGAGGIGCYYGAKLVNARHEVTFVARGEHLTAMQADGLSVTHPDFSFKQKVSACSLDDLIVKHKSSDFDLLLICIKTTSTFEIANVLKEWINTKSGSPYILSLQNGMGNEQVFSDHLNESKIIGGLAVRIGADVIKPANVTAVGIAQIIMGAWPHNVDADPDRIKFVSKTVEMFNQAGIPTKESDDIRKELWRKLMINNGTNPLSALIQKDTKYLSHHEEYAMLMKHMMNETALASQIDGSDLKETDAQEMFQLIYDFDAIKPSMLIDREKGRTLELDAICGVVINNCETLGKDAPYTRTIYTLLKNLQ